MGALSEPEYTRHAAAAIGQAARTEHDFGGWLAVVLAAAAAGLGSSDALTAGRPGGWEASLVDRLVKGTVGWSDEHLASYAAAAGEPATPAAILTAGQLATLGRALADALDWRATDTACPECDRHPAGLCDDHSADMDLCDAYRQLAADLGITLEDR